MLKPRVPPVMDMLIVFHPPERLFASYSARATRQQLPRDVLQLEIFVISELDEHVPHLSSISSPLADSVVALVPDFGPG